MSDDVGRALFVGLAALVYRQVLATPVSGVV